MFLLEKEDINDKEVFESEDILNTGLKLGQHIVVAVNGLNLRAAPNLKAKKRINIPYLSKVEVLDVMSHGRDTLYASALHYNDQEDSTRKIIGDWIKVKFKENTGFAFSSYLLPQTRQYKQPKALKDNFAFTFVYET